MDGRQWRRNYPLLENWNVCRLSRKKNSNPTPIFTIPLSDFVKWARNIQNQTTYIWIFCLLNMSCSDAADNDNHRPQLLDVNSAGGWIDFRLDDEMEYGMPQSKKS